MKLLLKITYFFCLMAAITSCSTSRTCQQPIPYKVSLESAHTLVKVGKGPDYKDALIDLSKTPNKDGFFLMHGEENHGELVDKKTGKHNYVYEWYAVNAWTGDVWTVARCQRLSNPALHIPLEKIKSLFQGKEAKEYQQLRLVPAYREGPEEKRCEKDDADYSNSGIASHESVPYKVNFDRAYKLIGMIIRNDKNIAMDSFETPDENGFFTIDLYIADRDGVAGRYAINAWTGDVWDVFSCQHISNPNLRKAQAYIKKRFYGNEIRQYRHLSTLRPSATDLEPCGSPDN